MADLKTKLIIFGAGGLGAEVAWAVESCNAKSPDFEFLGFCDDDATRRGSSHYGYPVLGTPEEIDRQYGEKPNFICAVGNNRRRAAVVQRILALGWIPARVIDPSVVAAKDVTVGLGTYVAAGVTISPDAKVGSHVILNLNCLITHNNRIEDFVQICPGASISGFGLVKTGAVVGSNAVIAPGITVGAWATVGACSFAISDIPDGTTAVGNPARPMFRSKVDGGRGQ